MCIFLGSYFSNFLHNFFGHLFSCSVFTHGRDLIPYVNLHIQSWTTSIQEILNRTCQRAYVKMLPLLIPALQDLKCLSLGQCLSLPYNTTGFCLILFTAVLWFGCQGIVTVLVNMTKLFLCNLPTATFKYANWQQSHIVLKFYQLLAYIISMFLINQNFTF